MKEDKQYFQHQKVFQTLPVKFTSSELKTKLKAINVKYDKNFLSKLLNDGQIRSIDSRIYQKNIGFDDRERTMHLKKFDDLSKIVKDESILRFREGFTNIITGIDEKDFEKLPEWKKTILSFVFDRLNAIFIIINDILSYSNEYPSKNSRQYRELLLAILPYLYSRKFRGTELEDILKNVFLPSIRYKPILEEVEKILEIYDKKYDDENDKWDKNNEFLEKFGMLLIPRVEFADKETIRAKIEEGIQEKKSNEDIAWSILIENDNLNEISKILNEYSKQLDVKKIEQYLRWVVYGKKITPLLYKADFHFRVLDAIENKKLREGFYQYGKLQSRIPNSFENEYMDGEDGHRSILHEYPMFNEINKLEYLRIYDSDHHAKILNEKIKQLKKLISDMDFGDVITSVVFSDRLITPSVNEAFFRYEDLKLLELFNKEIGTRFTKLDMSKYLNNAEKIRKDFLKKMFG